MGTGTRDMIRRCIEAGLQEPVFTLGDGFVTQIHRTQAVAKVTPEVTRLLLALSGEMSRAELMASLGLSDEKHFREPYQQAAVGLGLVEMTRPAKSRLQKYRLTTRGKAMQKALSPG